MKYVQNVRYLNCFAPSSSVALKQGEYLYGAQTVLSRLLLYEICAECSLYIYIYGDDMHPRPQYTQDRPVNLSKAFKIPGFSCLSLAELCFRLVWHWSKDYPQADLGLDQTLKKLVWKDI